MVGVRHKFETRKGMGGVFVFIFFLIQAFPLVAQTKVSGKIICAETKEPLPFATVVVPGTTIGTTTQLDGTYVLEAKNEITEITASYVSYESLTVAIKPGVPNSVDFELFPMTTMIDEVLVTPGENPAEVILKQVSKNKKRNNPLETESYSYSTYSKMELDLSNMKPEFKNKRVQRNFGFIYEYMDTSSVTGKAYLPIMISETTKDHFYRKSPKLSREVVKASRVTGMEDYDILLPFTEHLNTLVNLYDNYINLFNMNFVSPLCDHGTVYYKYYLIDSTMSEGRKIYKIQFTPKNKNNPAFDGEVCIDSLTWGLASASMRMVQGLNVNWIRDLAIENQSQLVNDSTWFMKQNKIVADFSVSTKESSKLTTFMAQKQVDYFDVRVNEEIPSDIARLNNDLIMKELDVHREHHFWDSVRPYELTERERGIYTMVDSIKNVRMFKNFTGLLNTVLFGHLNAGKVEFGPYYKLYSRNKLEGDRIQLGVRTTKDFSRDMRLSAYGAYGFRDEELKGGATFEYMFSSLPTSLLTVSAQRDAIQLGATKDAYTTGNVMGSIFARGGNNKLTLTTSYNAKYEREWSSGFSNVFGVEYRQIIPNERVPFVRADGTEMKKIRDASLRASARFSREENVIRNYFEKLHMGSPYPIFEVDLTGGFKDILNSEYNYLRAELTMDYDFSMASLGRTNLVLTGGKIFGKVPYPLLKLHEGNATYLYDRWAFSCMNFYEFASDLWGSILFEHHFRGLFFNHIPLINKTTLREVFTMKCLWGSLSDKNNGSLSENKAILQFPQGMSSVNKPYIELGCGVENIFRLFRVDAVWRVTHRDSRIENKISNFSVNFSFNMAF